MISELPKNLFSSGMMLCPEMTLLSRTYVTKRRLKEFIPIFERLFDCQELHHVLVLSLFWNFFFLSWPAEDQLIEMVDFAPRVIDKIYRVLVRYSSIPEVYDLVDLAEMVEIHLRKKPKFTVHPDFKIILRESMVSC